MSAFVFRTRPGSGVGRVYDAIPADGEWIVQSVAFAAANVSDAQGAEHVRRLAGFGMVERDGGGNAARYGGKPARVRRAIKNN